LIDCRISNTVKCLPPENKPERSEILRCNHYLAAELAAQPGLPAILALGTIAHEAALKALALKPTAYRFGHGAEHALPNGTRLFDSYHCSRYNTQTKRLTAKMFEDSFASIRRYLDHPAA
jgi:uracil-DNA glycosylase family 4